MATGSVAKRGKSWRARVIVATDPTTGKRRVASKTFRLKKDADKWVAAQLEALRKDEFVEPSTEPLSTWLDHWLATSTASDASYVRYATVIRRHLAPALGSVRLCVLSPRQIQDLCNTAAASMPTTARLIHQVLSGTLA